MKLGKDIRQALKYCPTAVCEEDENNYWCGVEDALLWVLQDIEDGEFRLLKLVDIEKEKV